MMTPEMKQLILDDEDAALVFGHPDREDVHIIFVSHLSDLESAVVLETITAQKLHFAGVLSQQTAKCASPETVHILISATGVYARCIAAKIKAEQAPRGDSVEWLEKLFALADERIEFGPA